MHWGLIMATNKANSFNIFLFFAFFVSEQTKCIDNDTYNKKVFLK